MTLFNRIFFLHYGSQNSDLLCQKIRMEIFPLKKNKSVLFFRVCWTFRVLVPVSPSFWCSITFGSVHFCYRCSISTGCLCNAKGGPTALSEYLPFEPGKNRKRADPPIPLHFPSFVVILCWACFFNPALL